MMRLPPPGGSTSDSGMGNFRVAIQVGRQNGERLVHLDALVSGRSSWPTDARSTTRSRGSPFELARISGQRLPSSATPAPSPCSVRSRSKVFCWRPIL